MDLYGFYYREEFVIYVFAHNKEEARKRAEVGKWAMVTLLNPQGLLPEFLERIEDEDLDLDEMMRENARRTGESMQAIANLLKMGVSVYEAKDR